MGARTGLHKSRGGLIRCEVTVEDDRIMDIILSGDFFLYPEDALTYLADALCCLSTLSRELFLTTINDVYTKQGIISLGCEPIDFVSAITNALKEETVVTDDG